jgi:hypothetical protein
MSIESILAACVKDGRLVEVRSILDGHRQRLVFAPPNVLKELDPDTVQDIAAENAGQLRAWIDGFTKGRRITVGSGKSRHADMKVLDPRTEEVWELRKRDKPSTRIFGRFAMKDVFIATNIRTTRDLFSLQWVTRGYSRWPVWQKEIRKCKAVWRSLFLSYEPLSGETIDDYLSNAYDGRDK